MIDRDGIGIFLSFLSLYIFQACYFQFQFKSVSSDRPASELVPCHSLGKILIQAQLTQHNRLGGSAALFLSPQLPPQK